MARSLAREVEEGMAASDANDPDLQAKDADLHLLNVSERTRKRHRFGTDNV